MTTLDPRLMAPGQFPPEQVGQQPSAPPVNKLTSVLKTLAPAVIAAIAAKQGGPRAGGMVLERNSQNVHQEGVEQQRQAQIAETRRVAEQARLDRESQLSQQQNQKAAEFRLKAIEQLGTIDDPAQWTATARQLDDTYTQMFGAPKGTITTGLTFNDGAKLKKDQKAAQDVVTALEKRYTAPKLWEMNPTVTFQGKQIKYHDLVALTGLQAQTDTGAMTPPDPIDPESKTTGSFDAQFNDVLSAKETTIGRKLSAAERANLRLTEKKKYDAANDRPTQGPRDRFNVQPYTKKDGTIGFLRVNLDTGDAAEVHLPDGAASGGKPSDMQRLSAAYADRTTQSDKTAMQFEAKLTGLGAQYDVQLPNLLKSPEGQRYKQAEDEFINAALRRESGAAIQPSEYDRFEKIYFVRPGDTPDTIAQKQAARKRVVDGFAMAAGGLTVEDPAKASAVKKLQGR